MTKKRVLIFICITLFLILPLGVYAFAVKSGNSIYVAENETIEGNLYAAGNAITVDGTVTGDVICAGQAININGKVEGDVICAGQTINIVGEVGGNARVAGNSVNINGAVARNVMAFGASIILGEDATVGWDMLMAGATGEIRGKVGRDMYGGGSSVIIAGKIAKDVRLKLDENIRSEIKGFSVEKSNSPLTITDGAVIGGNVTYTAGQAGSIATGASISGEVKHNLPKIKTGGKTLFGWVWHRLFAIFSAFVVGLVLVSLWRKQIIELTDKMLSKVGAAIGWGLMVMFLTPIICLLLLFTIIGIPLSLMLLAIWLIAIFISKILIGILVGRSVMEKIYKKKKDSLIWAMIAGIVICWIIFAIPIIGWIIALAAIWWGLGGIWLYFKKT